MTAPAITDHVAASEGRLLQQLQGRPNWQALLAAIVGQVQRLEDVLQDVGSGRLFANASGQQLDGIGELVGIGRQGLTDDAYRLELRARIAANVGNGTIDDITDVAQGIFEADSVYVRTDGPASVAIDIGDPQLSGALSAQALQVLVQSLAAGVRLGGVRSFYAADSFRLAGVDPGLGLADINVSGSGGALASRIA